MSFIEAMIVGAAITAGVYLLLVAALVAAGRRMEAGALARFIPDCLVLLRRLLADERVPRRRKLALAALVAYLSMPFDLVPDFIPIAGQLDDVIVAALILRYVLRPGGSELLREHWPGPQPSRDALLRLIHRPTGESPAG